MAKHDADPVLQQLVHAVNESGRARVPVQVSAHGQVLNGLLIAEDAYFAELAEGTPLLSALQPASGLLGKDYAKEVSAGSDHHLHIRADSANDVWRISLESVDGWALGTAASAEQSDKGPFARLLSA